MNLETHYIKAIPVGTRCWSCGQEQKKLEDVAITNGTNHILCQTCLDELLKYEKDLEQEVSDSFKGSIEVMQVINENIKEKKTDLARQQYEHSKTTFLKQYFKNKIEQTTATLNRLHSELYNISPTRQKITKHHKDMKPEAKLVLISTILAAQGHKPQFKTTTSEVFLCPFHNEHTPSFHAYKKGNHAHCFGCGFHGDSIAVAMQLQKCTFQQALNYLVTNFC